MRKIIIAILIMITFVYGKDSKKRNTTKEWEKYEVHKAIQITNIGTKISKKTIKIGEISYYLKKDFNNGISNQKKDFNIYTLFNQVYAITDAKFVDFLEYGLYVGTHEYVPNIILFTKYKSFTIDLMHYFGGEQTSLSLYHTLNWKLNTYLKNGININFAYNNDIIDQYKYSFGEYEKGESVADSETQYASKIFSQFFIEPGIKYSFNNAITFEMGLRYSFMPTIRKFDNESYIEFLSHLSPKITINYNFLNFLKD